MATKKRRLKRKKKKTSVLSKWILALIAITIIGTFLYFLLSSGNGGKNSIEVALKKALYSTESKKKPINKTFDEKGNIVFKTKVHSNKFSLFLEKFKKEIPENSKIDKLKAGNKVLLKIDNGREITKILITLLPSKKRTERKKTKMQYEEPLPHDSQKPKRKEKIKIKGQPLLAIIIDDCGLGHMESFKKALKIPYPITFAILPFRTYSRKCAYLANGKGYRVILHMPMEPISYPKADPGPGAIFKTDRKKKIIEKLENAFSNISFAEGFNNHMGSAITQSRFAVRVILSYAEKHGKFFVDSRTTPHTVVEEEARKMGIKVLSRDVFLDNKIDYQHIKKQLDEAVKKAYQHGYSIAIGHNYPTTIDVLSKEMPKLDKKVNFIFVRNLYYGKY